MNRSKLLDAPMYTIADAAHLAELAPGRVRRWLYGYRYSWGAPGDRKSSASPPVLRRNSAAAAQQVSFLDLMELLVVKACLKQGVTLHKIRRAANEPSSEHKIAHRFATHRFYTLGRSLFVEFKDIGFDTKSRLAPTWWPLGRDRKVVVDPARAFGAPSVANHNIKTANVYSLYLAEGRDIHRVARWLSLEPDEVRDAVAFEEKLAV